jgi:hypothetical protein
VRRTPDRTSCQWHSRAGSGDIAKTAEGCSAGPAERRWNDTLEPAKCPWRGGRAAASSPERAQVCREGLHLRVGQREFRHVRGRFLARGIAQPADQVGSVMLGADVRKVGTDRRVGLADGVAAGSPDPGTRGAPRQPARWSPAREHTPPPRGRASAKAPGGTPEAIDLNYDERSADAVTASEPLARQAQAGLVEPACRQARGARMDPSRASALDPAPEVTSRG